MEQTKCHEVNCVNGNTILLDESGGYSLETNNFSNLMVPSSCSWITIDWATVDWLTCQIHFEFFCLEKMARITTLCRNDQLPLHIVRGVIEVPWDIFNLPRELTSLAIMQFTAPPPSTKYIISSWRKGFWFCNLQQQYFQSFAANKWSLCLYRFFS